MGKIEIRNRKFGPLLGFGILMGLGGCSWMPDMPDIMPEMGSSGSSAPLGATVTGVSTRYDQRDVLKNKGVVSNSDFGGAVVADEPNAALIARNILVQGGNAADAATALYFALSVSYPAAAGLGGGGVCIAHGKDGKTESIGFLPRRSISGGTIAVPGNVRGFAALQARHGVMAWANVVAPSERLAAVGMPLSRATASQLSDAGLKILANPGLAKLFSANSQALKELDKLQQFSLAATLALVRSQTTNGFYSGSTANLLVAESNGSLTHEDLKNYRPEIAPAQTVASGAMSVALPASSLGAGQFASTVWQNVGASGNIGDVADAGQRAAISLGAGNASLDGDYGSTAFAVVDGEGGAVACSVTMNGTFGTARVAEGSGIIFAAAPPSGMSLASAFLMPVIVTDASGKKVYFVGAGAGAPNGAAAITYAAQSMLAGKGSLAEALDNGPADLRSPASAIACSDGLPGKGICTIAVNPKGNGVGFSAVAPDS